MSRTDSDCSDVKIATNANVDQQDVAGGGRSVGQTVLASGFTNDTKRYSSNNIDSPMHREPLQDAQRDLLRQLQDANADLTKQLQETRTSASEREAQVQSELDGTRQKLEVMKEQLMTGQADAEETGRQILEQATHELHAKHALELQRVNAKVGISEKQHTQTIHVVYSSTGH